MRVRLTNNLIYVFVVPVIELFAVVYAMRNSNDVKMVIAVQLPVYSGIPFTFYINTGRSNITPFRAFMRHACP